MEQARDTSLAAKFVADQTIPAGTKVRGGQLFFKNWKVLNNGDRAWPSDATPVHVEGEPGFPSPKQWSILSCHRADPGAVGLETNVMVVLEAPASVGKYTSTWSLSAGGKHFGDQLKTEIEVESEAKTDGATVDVSVRMLSGKVHTLHAHSYNTVEELKCMLTLQAGLEVAPPTQRLICGGRGLPDSSTLADLDIQGNAVMMHLVLALD